MTVGEMMHELSQYDSGKEIEIQVRNPSVGPHRAVGVKTVVSGIDWDSGRVFILPDKYIVEIK